MSTKDRHKDWTIIVLIGLLFVSSLAFAAFGNDGLNFGPRGLSRGAGATVPFGEFGTVRGTFLLELVYAVLAVMALRYLAPSRSVPLVAFLVALPALNFTYDLHELSGSDKIVFPPETRDLVASHMLQHSDSDLVRFVDLSPDFSERLPKNHPWLVAKTSAPRAISSFTGYELHGAIGGDYAIWHGTWAVADNNHHYYSPNWASMQAVGTEFAIYETDRDYTGNLLLEHLDLSDPTKILDVPGTNLRVAPLVYPEKTGLGTFNNGIFEVPSNATVQEARTDFATRSSISIESPSETEVKFLLWPKTNNLVFRVDGSRVEPTIGDDGLALVELTAGLHVVEIEYKNLVNRVFVSLYLATLGVCSIVWLGARLGIRRHLSRLTRTGTVTH